ncbi:hypothetical protein [Komagataeibacter xylinus]|uniref:hypothetical protein n=1 Tax=Komagataeibacter xylinus TaxID=28448 RepID=UPI001F0F6EC6|nr:hypothetical protein [Komagataeibacter xylinus]
MDRQIVYPAQIPLDSDLLNAQRNAFVGLGHLAGMAYGDDTVAAGGFACTPGTGLTVIIAPGSLLAAGVVDATAYGTLAANGSVLVRQHISRDPVTLTVPGAGGTYTVYATPATVDTDDTVLPFYNAADPSVTYAGADNSGKTAPTVRQDMAQLGIATTVPDGAYPLWTITVPAAATAITADMIAQAEGAPFYETIPELQADLAGRLKLADPQAQTVNGPVTFTGETEVPDTEDFTGKSALNAETAEGRYVGSVIASGSTNVRITGVQEDASGTLIATMSDGTTQNYIPSGQIVQANSAYSHASGGNGNTIYATCNVTLKRSATFLVTGCSNYAKVTSGQSQVELQYSSDGTTFTTFGSGDTTTASCIYATGILTLDAGDYVIRTVAENGNNTAIGWSAILSYIAVSE